MLTNNRADEAESGITIKSTGISIFYKMSEEELRSFTVVQEGNKFLINLIDLPGHVDFSSEVTTSLRIIDGAIVAIDCIDDVCAQTGTIICQAFAERDKPLLAINKINRCFLELQFDGEKAYQRFQHIIEDVNAIIETFQDSSLGDIQVSPEKGTVFFCWCALLALATAKMYVSKFNVDGVKMMERLWGGNFFDPVTGKWSTQKMSSRTCKCGFVQFCFDPVKQIINICMNYQVVSLWSILWSILHKIGVPSKSEDKELVGKTLMKRVMQTWLPLSSVLFDMIVGRLPSVSLAQKYRVDNLYEGPLNDAYAAAIRNCDPDSPLVLYISKMVLNPKKGRFLAFGRVFSGTVCTGSHYGAKLYPRLEGPVYEECRELLSGCVRDLSQWMRFLVGMPKP